MPTSYVLILVLGSLCLYGAPAVEFNRDIRPILSDKCFTCHGPDKANRKTALHFDQEDGARAAFVPGDPDKSELIRRVTSDKPGVRMPPAYAGHDKLSEREIGLLKQWIASGAVWQKHWSLIAPVRPPMPAVRDSAFIRNPIDAFVLARLESNNLQPAKEAPRGTLLRRVTLDLTGLPPTAAELDAFLRDRSPGAYEEVVDRLLRSPRYAERMAIRWLEAARYSDTNGYQSDGARDMWRWRDWVIDAFNRNLPFDRFTVEQIAGDLLPNATLDQKIASGFHRNHRTNAEGGIVPEEFRVEYVADRADTTATVWLGLTMGCARCHDHKYDPISQKDFYRMFAFFNNVAEKGLVYNFGNEEPLLKAPTPQQQKRLAELDAQQQMAQSRFDELQPLLQTAQRKWEKRIAPGYDWTVTEGLVVQRPLEQGLRFDGKRVVELGSVAKFDYLDPFTLSATVTPEKPDGAILSRAEDYWEGEGYSLHLKDGKVLLHITKRWTDIGMRLETESMVPLKKVTHIAVTYDGHRYAKGVHVYFDGVPQKLRVLFDDLNFPIAYKDKDPFRIGGGGGSRFHGLIEDVRAYSRALNEAEVRALTAGASASDIASRESRQRTRAESDKLALCFLERWAPTAVKRAEAELLAARLERQRYHDAIPTVMVMAESAQPRETFLLKRGAYDAPGEKLTAGVPEALPPMKPGTPANRLGLAEWLVDRANPLTARVAVNRFWQSYFGTGLVKTSEDFGSQGEWPVHPELLDWLAVEFMESGWDTKAMQKLIVTSAVYRQDSRISKESLQSDPENRLLARGPRFRLPAEAIRDQALALSNLLVETVGGPPVKPYQPSGLWQELSGGKGYQPDSGDGLYRRSIYTYWKRTIAPPSMVIFDSPTREACTVRTGRTNTPLQALNLMNDVTYLEASRKLAERLLREGGATGISRLSYGWRLVLARDPKPAELQVLAGELDRFESFYASHPTEAERFLKQGGAPRDASLPVPQLAAYTALSSLLLNLDETITKE